MTNRGREDASSVIWDWRSDTNSGDSPLGSRRRKGVQQGLVGLVVGTAVYFGLSAHVGLVAWAVSSLILASALVSPDGIYAIDGLVAAVGKGVTLLVMVPAFYLIFLPFGIAFRRGRRDGMKRFYEEGAATYWLTRDTASNPEDRERLF